MAQVHRFRDSVAVHVGDGQTVYLTAATAEKLANALRTCAKDVKACRFMDSEFRTVEIAEKDEREFTMERK